MRRKCEALIDLDAIRANYALACRLAPNSKSIAVLKADAYGHGAIPVARALRGIAPAFAVAIVDEACELRDAGIDEPILVMEGVDNNDALDYAATHGLAVVIHNEQQLRQLEQASLATPLSVWLKIDTGMHRLGLSPQTIGDALGRVRASVNGADDVVVCTHLACADDPDNDMTKRQLQLFDACLANLDVEQSISNSGGILAFPDSHRDWNRPGYMLYGASPFATASANASELVPAMTLQSEVMSIREVAAGESVGYGSRWTAQRRSRIATIAIGYADGYPRHAPDGTPVLINGRTAPLAGVVSMDMITVDVTELEQVSVADVAILWGKELLVNDIASAAGTIGYELLTNVAQRVPRIY